MVMRTMRQNINVLKWMFVVILLAFGFGLVLPGSMGDRDLAMAAAVVNGEAVPQQRYSRALSQQMEQARRAAGGELSEAESLKLRRETLDALIDEVLALQQAESLGQTMSEAEFREAALNDPSLRNEQGVFDVQRYQQILAAQAQQGVTVAEAERSFQRGMLLSKIRGFWDTQAVLTPAEAAAAEARLNRQVQAQAAVWERDRVRAGLKLTEDEVRSYYSRNKQRWAKAPEYKLRQILIRSEFGASTETAKAKADALLARAKKGEDFRALAAKENADEDARKNGGDLGWLGRDDLRHPALGSELAFLKVGGLSQVVQTGEGFHILKLEGKKDGFEPTFDNTRAKAESDLRDERAAREAERLARLALADIKAGKSLAEAAQAHGGRVQTTAWFDRDAENALPALGKDASFANLMLSLDQGESSPQPVATDKAVAIAVLSAERPGKAPAKAEDAALRRRIAHAEALEKKSQRLYQAWIDGLKKVATIKDQSGLRGPSDN
jgi:peptidyl-prolyl cis-trans isomerase D